MPSIESIGHALVFKVDASSVPQVNLPHDSNTVAIRVQSRALEGMQKEAIVHYGPTDTTWRMVCDEGPYLNGTDLAPFPLAFYTAGMAFSFVEELLKHAETRGITINSLKVTQDNYYTMEGSALRGDMTGGAKPVDIDVALDADASPEAIREIVKQAEATSPPQSYMRDVLRNTFAICFNDRPIPTKRVAPSPNPLHPDPEPVIDTATPLDADAYQADIITKLSAAETVFNVEGGAGSSLQSEQKRTLHVRGIATLRDDGLKEVVVQLFKPLGSTFRFLSDDAADVGGQERAPSGLAYLSAGVGFCFMTQIGRYAHIVKQPLDSYGIVQDNIYHYGDDVSVADPVDTHVYVRFDYNDEDAQKLVDMSEQTCFLHAAMRTSNRTRIKIGDEELTLRQL